MYGVVVALPLICAVSKFRPQLFQQIADLIVDNLVRRDGSFIVLLHVVSVGTSSFDKFR